jgi:hypothetical protein
MLQFPKGIPRADFQLKHFYYAQKRFSKDKGTVQPVIKRSLETAIAGHL